MRWREFWTKQRQQQGLETVIEEEEDNDEVEEQDLDGGSTRYEDRVFKDTEIKTNLPRNHPVPAALSACIAATRFAILGAPLNNKQPNISPEVRAGGQDLVALQRERVLVIKPSDKTGGYCIMDFDDYKEGMDEKLKERFVGPDGVERDKYVRIDEKEKKEDKDHGKEHVAKRSQSS